MDEYIITGHALREMARDGIPAEAVYHVIGDPDEIVEQDDGRAHYEGIWNGRAFTAVVENDGQTVITAWERKRE